MLADPNNIPQNSLNPVPQNDADWQRFLQVQQAAQVSLIGFQQAAAAPSTFLDQGQGVMNAVGGENRYSQRQLLVLSDALKPDARMLGQSGAILDDGSDAPEVVPMNVVPSMQPPDQNSLADRQARLHLKRQPGTPWGVAPASNASACSGTTQGGILDAIKTNPWAWLFLLAGVVVVAHEWAKD